MSSLFSILSDGDAAGGTNGSGSNSSAGCEMCGWLAAFCGMIAFGSFGVPIKSKVAKSLNIDPLVMQTYKTTMCFITSWIFVLIRGEKYTFTPFGIVSGLFWVPGGVATIYAIKTAGLAIGIGVGSSFIVLVSFTWGIFVFGEHVHSRIQACTAVGCMLCGLAGMAYYSAPTVAHASSSSTTSGNRSNNINDNANTSSSACYQPIRPEDPDFLPPDQDEEDIVAINTTTDHPPSSPLETDYVAMGDDDDDDDNSTNDDDREIQDGSDNDMVEPSEVANGMSPTVLCCFGKFRVQQRTLGILAALVFTGIWGGSIMVPMQFAPKVDKGLGYLISFAIGAATVNLSLWIIRYLYLCYLYPSYEEAYNALPSFHLRKMWLYGGTCGLLWSIGNFFSILAVEYLGEGVGYSATQASMLVSGLWGIFYFNEVEGFETISKWFLSASVTVVGILLLSYEHHEK